MIGTARTFGAISVTNALPTGVGCAVGIALPVEARVTLSDDPSSSETSLRIPDECRTAVVEATLREALSTFLDRPPSEAALALRSEIPPEKGLKSSSAISTAILLATARASHRDPDALEIGRRAATVGMRCGVSATGALDDALAGLEPGFVVTDNVRGVVLRRDRVDPSLGVGLYIPANPHPRSPTVKATFEKERADGARAARAARDGDWVGAMQLNTELVERVMGYPYRSLRERLRERGAIAVGVSGLGPALAVIAPKDRLLDLVRELPSDGARIVVASFLRSTFREEVPA